MGGTIYFAVDGKFELKYRVKKGQKKGGFGVDHG